jgi:dUTPase
MADTIKFLKTRDVKSPTRAHQNDAGIDFYVPEFTPEFVDLLKQKNPDINISDFSIILEPGQRILIPSGIYCQMEDKNRCLIAANKSGVATKMGLIVGACVDGETIIETNKGKFSVKTLTKEFIEKNEILIKGYNENKKTFNYYKCDGFRISGEKRCIKLVFLDDKELICSEDHLILTDSGWKQAKDLLLTDNLIQ